MLTERMPAPEDPRSVLTLPVSSIAAPEPIPVPDSSPEAERLRAAADLVLRRGIRVPQQIPPHPPPHTH